MPSTGACILEASTRMDLGADMARSAMLLSNAALFCAGICASTSATMVSTVRFLESWANAKVLWRNAAAITMTVNVLFMAWRI